MGHDVARHFDQRAESYDNTPWVRDPAVMSATLGFLEPVPGLRILDVGAGTGAVLEAALAACPSLGRCVAMDVSAAMLAHIRDPRIERCCGDAEAIPFSDASFDAVVCRQTLHYIDDVNRCLREVRRVLAAGGRLVIGQITPFGEADAEWWRRIVHARQPLRRHDLTAADLAELLGKNGFTIVRTSRQRSGESLNAWLARYRESDEQIAEVRRLHAEAPDAYRQLHRFRSCGDDTVLDNCWTFIHAAKAGTAPARR